MENLARPAEDRDLLALRMLGPSADPKLASSTWTTSGTFDANRMMSDNAERWERMFANVPAFETDRFDHGRAGIDCEEHSPLGHGGPKYRSRWA